jgi:L,D-transpeptidase ErfK/SrfK
MMNIQPQRRREMLMALAAGAILTAALLGGCRLRGDGATGSYTMQDPQTLSRRIAALRKENSQLQGRIEKLIPKEPYIVINTTLNRLYLRKGNDVLLEAICSTGSNSELVTPDGRHRWFFSTPRGVYKIGSRQKDPVWVRPDWSFVELGEPIPPPGSKLRYEEGMLGAYAMHFGDGYMIHGTPFKGLLGNNVTHGCVRMGDDDLEKVWQATRSGTPVYLF